MSLESISKMELDVANVVIPKMPIVLISVDSENKNLVDFDSLDITVDVLLESPDPRSKAIGDRLAKNVVFINRLVIDRLSEGEDAEVRIQAAVNMIRSMNVGNAMIISHSSVLNSYKETTIKNEWGIIGM